MNGDARFPGGGAPFGSASAALFGSIPPGTRVVATRTTTQVTQGGGYGGGGGGQGVNFADLRAMAGKMGAEQARLATERDEAVSALARIEADRAALQAELTTAQKQARSARLRWRAPAWGASAAD
jgi:hypothetical protein